MGVVEVVSAACLLLAVLRRLVQIVRRQNIQLIFVLVVSRSCVCKRSTLHLVLYCTFRRMSRIYCLILYCTATCKTTRSESFTSDQTTLVPFVGVRGLSYTDQKDLRLNLIGKKLLCEKRDASHLVRAKTLRMPTSKQPSLRIQFFGPVSALTRTYLLFSTQ